jgi:hypothetical protein
MTTPVRLPAEEIVTRRLIEPAAPKPDNGRFPHTINHRIRWLAEIWEHLCRPVQNKPPRD